MESTHNFETMTNFYVVESNLNSMHDKIFPCRQLLPSEMTELHDACLDALKDEKDRRVAIRAEIMALLYYCQPEAIFRHVGVSKTVAEYLKKYMGLTRPNYSRYKRSLLFLYYNDKAFRTIADKTIEAASDRL